jgi:hypothetical protein
MRVRTPLHRLARPVCPLLLRPGLVGERFSAKDSLQGIQEDYRRGLEVTDLVNEIGTSAERCNALA